GVDGEGRRPGQRAQAGQPACAPPARAALGADSRGAGEAAAVAVALTGPGPVAHLLVTNDFPPKVGGIQSYLWELWRRLPPEQFSVLTTAHPDAAAFDVDQPFAIRRSPRTSLWPTPAMAAEIRHRAAETGAALVVLDPALPIGLVGPRLGLPYALVLHGA